MTLFTVFPAIDLRHGQVVRLAQGDPARQTVYDANPAAVAARWKADGARWLHVVNLDGAFTNARLPDLAPLTTLGLHIQFGGGLRDEASLTAAFEAGIRRAVLGTAAVERPELVEWAVREFGPERVAVGLDARDGQVRIKGWAESTALSAVELGCQLRSRGLEWCVFTDVARDGVGTGVNVPATTDLARQTGLRVIASGGVARLEDVQAVREAGLPGVIIGRALYERQLALPRVLGNTALVPPEPLTTDGVTVRLPRQAEMEFIRWLWADEATMSPVGGAVHLTADQAQRWYAEMVNPGSPADCFCLIVAGGQPVGEVSFHRYDPGAGSAELNIKIAAAHRRQGFGTTAARLLLEHFFRTLGGRVVRDTLAAENVAGQRFVAGLGFQGVPASAEGTTYVLTAEQFAAHVYWRAKEGSHAG